MSKTELEEAGGRQCLWLSDTRNLLHYFDSCRCDVVRDAGRPYLTGKSAEGALSTVRRIRKVFPPGKHCGNAHHWSGMVMPFRVPKCRFVREAADPGGLYAKVFLSSGNECGHGSYQWRIDCVIVGYGTNHRPALPQIMQIPLQKVRIGRYCEAADAIAYLGFALSGLLGWWVHELAWLADCLIDLRIYFMKMR